LSLLAGIFYNFTDMAETNRDHREIRIRGVGKQIRTDLENIAENLGTDISALIKPKLWEIANSYPDNMKLPPRKD